MFKEVLIADDDPVSRRLLQVSLGNAGYRVTMAVDGAQAHRILNEQDCPRLAVLDWMMPAMDGVEVCRAIRKSHREPYLYIILLTAKGHQTEIIEGLEAGADDYITKPFDLQELKARLRSGHRILELQEQLVTAREQLRLQATHDSLTGLFNRMAILEVLDRELTRSHRENKPVAVIMADLDHFKEVNDTHGHHAGDAVLQEAARRMLASLRVYDSVGRYGGEEFLLVVPGSGLDAAVELAERVRQRVAAEPVCVAGVMISTTLSLGLAVSTGETNRSERLLQQADEALYGAKNAGRNRVGTGLRERPTPQHAVLPQVR
jgi:two-component system, cell cycle response regulator